MSNIQFSIIVPVYKVERYLTQCVDSILNQDFDSFEIILVDDGSPDGCPQICDKYAAGSDRVKVVHKPNGGLSDARNAGLEHAKGIYVTFVDSDDFWKGRDVLSGVWCIITKNNYPDVVVSDFYKYYDTTDNYVAPPVVSDESYNGRTKLEILKYLYFGQSDMKMAAWQKFVRRELLKDIRFTKGLLSEDIDWTLCLYKKVSSICVYGKPYYCYRQQREGSITNTASQKSFDSLIWILAKWSKIIPELELPEEEKEIYLGYLAFQLSIAILLLIKTSPSDRPANIKQLKAYLYLFSYPTNYKTRKIALLTKMIGLYPSARVLNLYLSARRVFKHNKAID